MKPSNQWIDQAHELAQSVAATHALDVDTRGRFPAETLEALRQKGFLGLLSSTELNGHGESLRTAAHVVEALARECASSAMVLCMHYCATAVLEAHGDTATRQAVAAGKHLSTLAFSEAGSRSHFWAPVGTATALSNDSVALNAHKSWVTSAHHADSYVWSSKPLQGSEASSIWLVPRTLAGVHVRDGFDGMGLRGNDSCPVMAEKATVSQQAMLGKDGAGFGIMMNVVLPYFNVMNASCSLGVMEAALKRAAAHVSGTRYQHMGSALADLPTVRAYIAKARAKADMARALWLDTLQAIESGRADTMLRVLECKAVAGDTVLEVTDLALRVCGGAAFRKEAGVERMFRDARAASVMAPTSDVLYDFIGKAVCGLPLF